MASGMEIRDHASRGEIESLFSSSLSTNHIEISTLKRIRERGSPSWRGCLQQDSLDTCHMTTVWPSWHIVYSRVHSTLDGVASFAQKRIDDNEVAFLARMSVAGFTQHLLDDRDVCRRIQSTSTMLCDGAFALVIAAVCNCVWHNHLSRMA